MKFEPNFGRGSKLKKKKKKKSPDSIKTVFSAEVNGGGDCKDPRDCCWFGPSSTLGGEGVDPNVSTDAVSAEAPGPLGISLGVASVVTMG